MSINNGGALYTSTTTTTEYEAVEAMVVYTTIVLPGQALTAAYTKRLVVSFDDREHHAAVAKKCELLGLGAGLPHLGIGSSHRIRWALAIPEAGRPCRMFGPHVHVSAPKFLSV